MNKKKIINDPIYGFISVSHEILFDCISQPAFQRLRRIKQLGMSHLVYPGAQHTRFQHALGATHLMSRAVETLRTKGVEISTEEEIAVQLAILLHDIGHGPFSHSLESSLLSGVTHEAISLKIMESLNQQFDGHLNMAIKIFKGQYSKKFLHQMVSGQLDMDRLDYLRRDSFYSGVSEGTIGLDRIIQMLNVHEDQLVVDQKGVYSIEKFIMARRFMYWQVYLHKTSLAADQVMTSILKRAKDLIRRSESLQASPALLFFLESEVGKDDLDNDPNVLKHFMLLDDSDVVSAMKTWMSADDPVLSRLCQMLMNRRLPKIRIGNEPFGDDLVKEKREKVMRELQLSWEESEFFVYRGDLANLTYSNESEQIKIKYKNGQVRDIANAAETYSFSGESSPTVKYFISYPK